MGDAIGKRIKELREERELSMRELERRSGITQGHISLLESGAQTNPRIDTLTKIAKGLNVDLSELMIYKIEQLNGKHDF